MKKAVATYFHFTPKLHFLFSALLLLLADSLLLLPLRASCGDPPLPPASTQLSALAKVEQWLSRLENSAAGAPRSYSPKTAVALSASHMRPSLGISATAPLLFPSRAARATPGGPLPSGSAQTASANFKSNIDSAATVDVKRLQNRPASGLSPYRSRDPFPLRTASSNANGGAAAAAILGAASQRVSPSMFFTGAANARHQAPADPGKLEGTTAPQQSFAASPAARDDPTSKHRPAAGVAGLDGSEAGHRLSAAGATAEDGAKSGHRSSAAGAAALDGAKSENRYSVADSAVLDVGNGRHRFPVVDHAIDRPFPSVVAAGTSKRNEMLFSAGSGAQRHPDAFELSSEYPPTSTAEQKEQHQRTSQAKQQQQHQQQPYHWNDASTMTYTWPSFRSSQAPESGSRSAFDAVVHSTTSHASGRIDLPNVEPYLFSLPTELYPPNHVNRVSNPGMGEGGYSSDAERSSSFIDMLLKTRTDPHSSNVDSSEPKNSTAVSKVDQQQLPSASPIQFSVSEMVQQLKPPPAVSTEATGTATARQATRGEGFAEKTPSKEQRSNSWRLLQFLDDLPATEASTLFFSPSVNTTAVTGRNEKLAEADGASAAKNKAALAAAAAGFFHRSPGVLPAQQSTWQLSHVLRPKAEVATGGREDTALGDESVKEDTIGSIQSSPLLSEYIVDAVVPDSAEHLTQVLRQMTRPLAKQNEAGMERQQQQLATQRSATLRQEVQVEETPKISRPDLWRGEGFLAPKDHQQYAKLPLPATPTPETVPQKKAHDDVWLQGVKDNGQRLSGKKRKRWEMPPDGKDDEVTTQQAVKEGDVPGSTALDMAENQLGGRRGGVGIRPGRAFFPFFLGQSLLSAPHQQHQSQEQALQLQQRRWRQPQEEEDPLAANFAFLQQQQHVSDALSLQREAVPQQRLHVESTSRETLGETSPSSSYSGSTTEDENTFSTAGTTTTDTLQNGGESTRTEGARQQTFPRKSQKLADVKADQYAKPQKTKKHKAAKGLREDMEMRDAKVKKRKGKKAHKRKAFRRHKAAAKPEREPLYKHKLPKGASGVYGKDYGEGVGAAKAIPAGGQVGAVAAAAHPVRQGALPSKLPYDAPPVKPYEHVSHPPGDAPPPGAASMLPSPPASTPPLETSPAEGPISGAEEKKLAVDAAEDKHEGSAVAIAKPSPKAEAGLESTLSTGRHALDGQFLVSTAKKKLDRELGVRSRLERSDIMHVAWKALKAMAVTTSTSGRLLYLRLTRKLPWSWRRFVKELPVADDRIIPEFRSLRRKLEERNTEVLIVSTPSAALKHLIVTEHPDAVLAHGVVIKARVIDARRTAKCASEVNGLMKIVPRSPFMLSAYGAWVSHPRLYSSTPLLEGKRKGSGGKGGAGNKKEDGLSRDERLDRLNRKRKKEKKQKMEPMILYVVTARARGDMDDYIHEQRYSINVEMAAAEMLYSVFLLHDAGFLHRDIKLMNFFVTFEGHVELGDFDGVWPVGVPVSTKDFLLYTKGYLAPEVDINQKFAMYTPKSDMYALGICFKELHEAKPNMLKANLFKDLYKRMTAMNPEKRPSALQAMQHPFFKDIDFSTLEQLKHSPPLPGNFATRAGFYG